MERAAISANHTWRVERFQQTLYHRAFCDNAVGEEQDLHGSRP